MNRFDNPFHDLWITEILNPDDFVKMFSPYVASHAEELFSTGNVVVRGRQGSGKSMLLGLLNTRTRVAYWRCGEAYPAPVNCKPFVAAGVNLTRDNARIVASRLAELPEERRRDWAAATFADYINYLLAQDLIDNVLYLAGEQAKTDALSQVLPIDWSPEAQVRFVELIIASNAWYGYMDGCDSVAELRSRVVGRLTSYRKYFNFNADRLDPAIEATKTDIGEPAAVVADCLRAAGVIPGDSLVFLKVDQHEELFELERASGYGKVFRQVINRALAMRDSRVSYRIGTRHYAWSEEVSVWGSGAHLEMMRDYSTIDIDQLFRRHENSSSRFSFRKFSEDVFQRRLAVYGFHLDSSYQKGILVEVFGESLSPSERAKLYAKDGPPRLDVPGYWAPEWRNALETLWSVDPLAAKLGEAWLRQQAQQRARVHLDPAAAQSRPWLEPNKEYWRKERHEAALVQIAGDAAQTLVWCGDRHLVDLAGWNILAFMTICRAVWGAWLRRTTDEELQRTRLPRIGRDEQTVGVHEASRIWVEKLKEGSDGDRRSQFVRALGAWFSARIRNDRALSNPGQTGISLLETEFDKRGKITDLIRACRDHGDLMERPHTTKEKDAKPRIKWYLNPLLCPFFRIPHVRTKEPKYTTLGELELVYDGEVPGVVAFDEEAHKTPYQQELF